MRQAGSLPRSPKLDQVAEPEASQDDASVELQARREESADVERRLGLVLAGAGLACLFASTVADTSASQRRRTVLTFLLTTGGVDVSFPYL
jgi:hypothetical protein